MSLQAIQKFKSGIFSPIQGWRILKENKSLQKWALAPGLLTALLVLGFLSLTWVRLETWSLWVLRRLPYGDILTAATRPENWGFLKRSFVYLASGTLEILTKIFLIFGAALAGYLLAIILCAFLWEELAAKTARFYGWKENSNFRQPFYLDFLLAMVREVVKTSVLIIVPLMLWMFSFIPVIGPAISIVLVPASTALIFGYNLSDYFLSAENIPLRARWRWIRRNMPYMLGVGLVGFLPILNILFTPLLIPALTKALAESWAAPPREAPLQPKTN